MGPGTCPLNSVRNACHPGGGSSYSNSPSCSGRLYERSGHPLCHGNQLLSRKRDVRRELGHGASERHSLQTVVLDAVGEALKPTASRIPAKSVLLHRARVGAPTHWLSADRQPSVAREKAAQPEPTHVVRAKSFRQCDCARVARSTV